MTRSETPSVLAASIIAGSEAIVERDDSATACAGAHARTRRLRADRRRVYAGGSRLAHSKSAANLAGILVAGDGRTASSGILAGPGASGAGRRLRRPGQR